MTSNHPTSIRLTPVFDTSDHTSLTRVFCARCVYSEVFSCCFLSNMILLEHTPDPQPTAYEGIPFIEDFDGCEGIRWARYVFHMIFHLLCVSKAQFFRAPENSYQNAQKNAALRFMNRFPWPALAALLSVYSLGHVIEEDVDSRN